MGNVLLGYLGPDTHVDVTLTCSTYLNTVADQVLHFLEMVFHDSSGLFHQDIVPCPIAKKWFKNGLRTTAYLQKSSGAHASTGQGYFGGKKGTYLILSGLS